MAKNFSKDINNDGRITKMVITNGGIITPGNRAGISFGLANEKMDL